MPLRGSLAARTLAIPPSTPRPGTESPPARLKPSPDRASRAGGTNIRRKLMRTILAAGLIAAGAWCIGAQPSSAAPANGVALGDAADQVGVAESVHCRSYRHWHS